MTATTVRLAPAEKKTAKLLKNRIEEMVSAIVFARSTGPSPPNMKQIQMCGTDESNRINENEVEDISLPHTISRGVSRLIPIRSRLYRSRSVVIEALVIAGAISSINTSCAYDTQPKIERPSSTLVYCQDELDVCPSYTRPINRMSRKSYTKTIRNVREPRMRVRTSRSRRG